ncbi:ankyrin repeat protein [Colletotrichum tofieldiae]|nr:ankyrin repeat protein [Colletotrichum tofieldiae]
MVRLCSQADRLQTARILDDSREILRWLSSVPYIQHHKHHSQQRVLGTGQWLLRHPRFTDWLSLSSSSILILHGIPGCGKTSLASLVIDSYQAAFACPPRPVAPVAYFYCSQSTSEPERSDAREILRSLVRQIATGHKTAGQTSSPLIVHASVMTEFERRQAQAARDGFDTERLSASECVNIIRTFTASEPLTIIVDATDEVAEDDLDILVRALQDVVRQSDNVTKILLTNRDDGRLFSLLPHASRIRISSGDVQGDMTRFVEHEVSTALRRRRLLGGEIDEETRNNIQRALVSGAGEMFQSAKLQLERMCLMKTAWDIRAMEQSLPATLRDLYNDVFQRLRRSGDLSTTLARHAFQWLLHVRRPLSTAALIEAIKSSASDALKRTKVNITMFMVEDVCMHLVIADSELNIVRLSHVSVREYLLERPEFQAESAHGLIAQSCLRASSFLMPMGDDDSGDEQSLENTYTNYAIAHWPMHYQLVSSSNQSRDARLEEILLGFVLDGSGQPTTEFMIWIDRVYWVSRRISRDDITYKRLAAVVDDQSSPLFVAAEYGIVDIIRKLDAWPQAAWDRKNELGNTALYLASVAGHCDVVKLLIERGASPDRRGGKLGTPVHAAAFHAREEVVSLLLKAGADPRNGVFANPVEAALTANHDGFALNLLQKENPGLSIEEYEALMEYASRGGHVDVMQWIRSRLLHDGTPGMFQKSLAQAIQHGKLGVIKYLLRKQPASDNILPTDAIALAALHGQEDVLVLCLQKGSAIDQPGPFGTPIRTACLMGHESIVRFLLAHGAKTTLDQPLQAAALRNHIDVAKTLLYVGGIGANEPGSIYETAITSAAYHGHESIVKILLDSGADPIAASGTASRFVNAYQAAIEGGHAPFSGTGLSWER